MAQRLPGWMLAFIDGRKEILDLVNVPRKSLGGERATGALYKHMCAEATRSFAAAGEYAKYCWQFREQCELPVMRIMMVLPYRKACKLAHSCSQYFDKHTYLLVIIRAYAVQYSYDMLVSRRTPLSVVEAPNVSMTEEELEAERVALEWHRNNKPDRDPYEEHRTVENTLRESYNTNVCRSWYASVARICAIFVDLSDIEHWWHDNWDHAIDALRNIASNERRDYINAQVKNTTRRLSECVELAVLPRVLMHIVFAYAYGDSLEFTGMPPIA